MNALADFKPFLSHWFFGPGKLAGIPNNPIFFTGLEKDIREKYLLNVVSVGNSERAHRTKS